MGWAKLLSAAVTLLAALVKEWQKHQIKQEVRREYDYAAIERSLVVVQYQLDVAAGRAAPPVLRVRPDAPDLTGLARLSCPVCGTVIDLSQRAGPRMPPPGG